MKSEAGEVTVILYCDEPVRVAGLKQVLASAPDIRLVSAHDELAGFLDALERAGAGIALVDAPSHWDRWWSSEISRRAPGARIVLWARNVNAGWAREVRAAGIAGILRRQLSGELIIRCLRAVASGGTWFEWTPANPLREARSIRLTPRERELVELISQGCSNKEIAEALLISEGTVKVYFSKLFHKVGARDRIELALFGLQDRQAEEAGSTPFLAPESAASTGG